jgi:hypothetical protein
MYHLERSAVGAIYVIWDDHSYRLNIFQDGVTPGFDCQSASELGTDCPYNQG